ncbi:MAG: type I DNA topoisomerase [Rhizobiaceae bacterium]|nr:type I DNA topoisomerase [Rhizobiaceae bacterium]
MKLVIVESPAKAKTINKYLGSDYKVLASYGHVRDLPAKDGSVLPDEDFAMSWSVDGKAKPRLTEITKAAKTSDSIILATDPDREGEAISWHVLQVLSDKKVLKDKKVERVVFNAITKKSILEAMENPRAIDEPLVNAYLARRALDYLVGFNLSPVLWRKLPGARSAGRVQSVALRLVCERENEIERFKPQEYWTILGEFQNSSGADFTARLTSFEGEKLQRLDVKNEEQASTIKRMLMQSDFKVQSVEARPTTRNPYAPFTTSTLQQEASSKLGFSASRTMQVAQKLYEGIDLGGETVGLITYMRTDGVQIAPEAIEQTRKVIGEEFGTLYLPEKARFYSSKAKNAQEAHEAVRPTSLARMPKEVAGKLDDDQRRLYDLIWKRTIASQMASAKIERTTAELLATANGQKATMRANGSVIKFDGFLSVYQDTRKKDDEEDKRLVPLSEGEAISREAINASQHFTEPPARYSEASLIRKMEELGIGRPSTYASTLKTLADREYVTIEQRRLTPQAKGRLVTSFLESFFNRYVEYDFTASLEDQLDRISAGDLQWKDVLREFWMDFSAAIGETKDLRITEVLDKLNEELGPLAFPENEDGSDPRLCPTCSEGQLSLKVGRFGAFIGCSNYPDCKFTRQLGAEGLEQSKNLANDGPKILGIDPNTSEEVKFLVGRFGPYVQRGEGKEGKNASIPKSWDANEIDFEKALQLLELPRLVGPHPETGKDITARFARYGPVVQHDGKFGALETDDEVFSVGINRAVAALADSASKGGRGRTASNLKELGEHPELGGPVTVKSGRFGPYANHGKINATLPKDLDPQTITMELAIGLIAAKAEKSGKKPAKKKAKAKKKAPAKKKPAAKKAATNPAE